MVNKYYSLNKIKKKNAVYNVIFGERSNGKTYALLKEGIKVYLEKGVQMAIVRRWKEDITGKRASGIFNAINENENFKVFIITTVNSFYATTTKIKWCIAIQIVLAIHSHYQTTNIINPSLILKYRQSFSMNF